VGKTALALRFGHQIAKRFGGGQLYVNLRGLDPATPPLEPGEVLRYFLNALGVPPYRIPADTEGRTALYRSLLDGRPMLIVLDNARNAAQVRPLLPGSPGSLVLVTSRNELTGLVAAEGARPLTLEVLSAAEAHEMLARRLGRDRVAAEPKAAAEIIEYCARLPLALSIAAGRAVGRPKAPAGRGPPPNCATSGAGWTCSKRTTPSPTCAPCFPGPTTSSARPARPCSGCSACIRAGTSHCRRRPAWPG